MVENEDNENIDRIPGGIEATTMTALIIKISDSKFDKNRVIIILSIIYMRVYQKYFSF